MDVGSLFTGIGGFDLGLENVGFKIAWQVENDKLCNRLLEEKWPWVRRHEDIRDFLKYAISSKKKVWPVDVIVGGDPCPSRSLAKGNRKSRHPDLAGYFLAVVGRLRPQWVVRENVPAPDVIHFAACLEVIGYRVVAFALDARDFTSQSRRRQIVIGCAGKDTAARFKRCVLDAADGFGFSTKILEEKIAVSCITSAALRLAGHESYVYECNAGRLRILTLEECEGLQGFPRGWTAGFSRSRRRIMLGNAIPVPFAEFIGRLIMKVEEL